jgi:hypothetical protein
MKMHSSRNKQTNDDFSGWREKTKTFYSTSSDGDELILGTGRVKECKEKVFWGQ